MRHKERIDNWRASAVIKRDFKHDHSEPVLSFRSHKETNKWCQGKKGLKHDLNWHKETWLFGIVAYVADCSKCNKNMYKSHVPK